MLKRETDTASANQKNKYINMSSRDDISSREESQAAAAMEQVQQISISELYPFEGHPFRVVDDEAMLRMVESISKSGVITPIQARPDPYGGYEIISGHRRCHAAKLAGFQTLPVIVREMDEDESIIVMADANLQRENILPSERARAYKMKLEAIKHQGVRSDLTSDQVGQKLRSVDKIAIEANDSAKQVQRYIRLTNLIPELLNMVDEKKIASNPAVEISYLKKEEQESLLEAMNYVKVTPSVSQAQRLKKQSQTGSLSFDFICEVLSERKKDEADRVTFKANDLKKYFPKSYTPRQMENTIIRLLEQWQKKRQRDQAR